MCLIIMLLHCAILQPVVLDELKDTKQRAVRRPKWFEIRGTAISDWDFNNRPYSLINKETIEWMVSKGFMPRLPHNSDFDNAQSQREDFNTMPDMDLIVKIIENF